MRKPKRIYGAGINLYGLWSSKPIEFFYNKELNAYYDESGDLSVEKIGKYRGEDSMLITFSSTKKNEVELFISGALAAYKLIYDSQLSVLKEKFNILE